MTTLEKIRAEIAKKFFEHGFGNTKVCYEVLQILDKYTEQEPTIPCDLCGFNMDDVCEYLSVCPAIGKAVSK